MNTVLTETTDGINISANQLEVNCITSKENKFHLDSEGNLSVNSITTVVDNKNTSTNVDFNSIYPIGSIYMNTTLVDPTALFGGIWEQLKSRFLLGASESYEIGSTGGEETHTLTANEMPEHTHIQYSHNHTQNSHNHTQNAHSHRQNDATWMNATTLSLPKGSYYYAETNDIVNRYTDAAIATNNATTATNNATIAINQNTGGSQPHNNMPPYLAVYMWKRVA